MGHGMGQKISLCLGPGYPTTMLFIVDYYRQLYEMYFRVKQFVLNQYKVRLTYMFKYRANQKARDINSDNYVNDKNVNMTLKVIRPQAKTIVIAYYVTSKP